MNRELQKLKAYNNVGLKEGNTVGSSSSSSKSSK